MPRNTSATAEELNTRIQRGVQAYQEGIVTSIRAAATLVNVPYVTL
jgi:hypothetical protein